MKFGAYLVYSAVITGFVYPISGMWKWGGGWLAAQGFHDFAGSVVVHAVGGFAGLAGAIVLGPRIGKFNADGSPNTLAGHHLPMAMLGCFILLFGWFGFNAASTFAATDVQFATVAANTAIAAAFGAVTAMLFMSATTGKPDPGMMVNGMLAGLVAITAPCAFVDPWAAAVIGILAAMAIPNYRNFADHAREGSVKANMHSLQVATEDFAIQNDGEYPTAADAAAFAAAFPGGFPANPFSGVPTTVVWDQPPAAPGEIGFTVATAPAYALRGYGASSLIPLVLHN